MTAAMSMSSHIIGSCMDMCPEHERKTRELQMRLHPLEMVSGTEATKRPRADPLATIKEYSRPAAGKKDSLNSDLRPPQVLLKTTLYMIHRLIPRLDYPYVKLYDFVFDRLRSIRQDLVIQQVTGPECVQILEIAVRFHLHSGYRLCVENSSLFDGKINSDHTQECLKRLLLLYREADHEGAIISDNREEFEALYLLFNLGSTEALRHIMSLSKKVRQDLAVQLALDIHSAYCQANFWRVWRLGLQCDYIQSCALHRHLRESRRRALQVLNTAYSSRSLRFPVSTLSAWLLFDTDLEATQLCRAYGLDVDSNGVQFLKSSHSDFASHQPPLKCRKLVDANLQGKVKVHDLILGRQHRGHPPPDR